MSRLNLIIGDKVRNIGNSARKGWVGVVAGDDRGMYAVYYADSGRTQSYDKRNAHHYIERVEEKAPQCKCIHDELCESCARKLTKALTFAQRYCAPYGATHKSIGEAAWNVLGFERNRPTRRVLKKVRRNVISGKTQDAMVKEMGHARGVQQFNTRCIGRSTGQALRVIGDAMCNPSVEIRITSIDHAISEGVTSMNRYGIDEHFRRLVHSLVGDMKGFTFTQNHIVFNPIVTEETYVETH